VRLKRFALGGVMCLVVEELAGATLDRIEAAYRRRLSELRRVATAIIGDREAALDAVQDAFASAVRQRTAFQGRELGHACTSFMRRRSFPSA
jgi:DNA-directed RNA polymerase specialized sigma24 family protein